MAGRIAVVDADNRFLRWEARRVIHEQRLVHRSVHILVVDSSARLLVQRRHRDKQTYPRTWDVSCAGHVEESDYPAGPEVEGDALDEVYAAVAARELEEELGVTPALTRLARFGPEPGVHYEQLHLFLARSDGPYRLQAEEVEELRLLTRPEAYALIAGEEPVTHALRWMLESNTLAPVWPAER